jgi:hypothetical protein
MICVPRDEKNFEDVERLVQKEIPRLENPLGGNAPAEAKAPAAKPDAGTKTSDKPRRSRSRSRKSDEAPKVEDAVVAAQAPALEEAKAPRKSAPTKANSRAMEAPKAAPLTEVKHEQNPEPKSEPQAKSEAEPKQEAHKADAPKDNDNNDRRTSRSRGSRSNNNDRGGNNKVVGLGDHIPTFIELSFADRPKD